VALVELLQHPAQLPQRHRMAEQVALQVVAAMVLEKRLLFRGFDPFGDHLQVQGVGHDDDRLDDLHVLGRLGDVLDERAIDLQGVQGQALEIGQG